MAMLVPRTRRFVPPPLGPWTYEQCCQLPDDGKRNIVQPDLIFISNGRASIRTGANAQGSPDLVVGVLSPSTRRRDLGLKRDFYAYYGVPHYWLVDPARRTLEAYELREGDYALVQRCTNDDTFTPAIFPGLSIPLALLWS